MGDLSGEHERGLSPEPRPHVSPERSALRRTGRRAQVDGGAPRESPTERLRRWRRALDRRHDTAFRACFSTRRNPSLFRREAIVRLRLRQGELELLHAIARKHEIPLATLAWSILAEWLAGTDNPRLAPGLSVPPIRQGERAERLYALVHESAPGRRFAPRPRAETRRLLRQRAAARRMPSLDETLPADWWHRRYAAPEDAPDREAL